MSFEEFVAKYSIAADLATGIGVWHADYEQLTHLGELNVPVHTILLVLNGTLCIRVKGERKVLTAGDYSDLLPHSQLRILNAMHQAEVWCLFFEDKSFQKIFRNRPPVTTAYLNHVMSKKAVSLPSNAVHTLRLNLASLYDTLLADTYPTRTLLLQSKLKIFFLEVDHLFAVLLEAQPPEQEQRSRHEFLFSQFIALLHKHVRSEHSVVFYAAQLCISTQYLGRIVRHVAQQKVHDFISYAVVGEIELLLADLSLPLKKVAQEMNFPNQAAFTKFYKRHTGLTPLEFRNQQK